jgi:hypothetical protein
LLVSFEEVGFEMYEAGNEAVVVGGVGRQGLCQCNGKVLQVDFAFGLEGHAVTFLVDSRSQDLGVRLAGIRLIWYAQEAEVADGVETQGLEPLAQVGVHLLLRRRFLGRIGECQICVGGEGDDGAVGKLENGGLVQCVEH